MTGDEVRNARFREKLRCYHPADVDKLLTEMASELDAGRSVAPLVANAKFREKLRGYHPRDVDKLLERITLG